MSEAPSDLADRENEIFERVVRPEVGAEDDAQKFVVMNVEADDYEIAPMRGRHSLPLIG